MALPVVENHRSECRPVREGAVMYPMQRDPHPLTSRTFDVLVIGAGIYGAWTTLDAVKRGLSVALIDQGDFGGATSANSQRILHGGLRYLQHADLRRMRESIRERSILLRIAPHLCIPQAFVVPTFRGFTAQSKMAMRIALKLNDWISFDRNRGVSPSRCLCRGKIISRRACLELIPGLEPSGTTGGAVFSDGQIVNSERFNLALVRSAFQSGAVACNYIKAVRFIREGNRIHGIEADDLTSGDKVSIRSKMTIMCAGPWTAQMLRTVVSEDCLAHERSPFPVLRAVVLVTRNFLRGPAVAIRGSFSYKDREEIFGKGYRNYFVTPWKEAALVGTFYDRFSGDPDQLRVTPEDIERYVSEFNQACPEARLSYKDVLWANIGLVPKAREDPSDDLQYEKQYTILDHRCNQGIEGLITVVGVKWTSARDVAEKTVNWAMAHLGAPSVRFSTRRDTNLYGCGYGDFERFVADAKLSRPAWLSDASLEHLIECHGDAFSPIVEQAEKEPRLREVLCKRSHTIAAEVIHAMREEMALTLSDVVLRRTPIGTLGWPGEAVVRRIGSLMARELCWDEAQTYEQIQQLHAEYERRGVWHEG